MDTIYRYDGTFEGFLCCVFDSYVNKEWPAGFQDEAHLAQTLFPVRWVGTDLRHANILSTPFHVRRYLFRRPVFLFQQI